MMNANFGLKQVIAVLIATRHLPKPVEVVLKVAAKVL